MSYIVSFFLGTVYILFTLSAMVVLVWLVADWLHEKLTGK